MCDKTSMANHFMGTMPRIVFAVAPIGGFVLWRLTIYQAPIDPHKPIITYLVIVILFIDYVSEDYLTSFEVAVTDIFGLHLHKEHSLSIAAFLAPAIWIAGAVLLLKRLKFK